MSEWYVVDGHLGGLTVRAEEPSPDSLYCEQCNDTDMVLGPVDLADPDGLLDVARSIRACPWDPPLPWEEPSRWFNQVEHNLRALAMECPEPVDVTMLMRRLRREVHARWALDGLWPFHRERNIRYWMRDTERWMETALGPDAASERLEDDWGAWDDHGAPLGPMVPVPWLGCLLEGRMRVLPEYRGLWLTLMERHPGWRFDPFTIPFEQRRTIEVRCMVRDA